MANDPIRRPAPVPAARRPAPPAPPAVRLCSPARRSWAALIGFSALICARPSAAAPPSAAATLDPNGAYSIVLHVQRPWISAEISVAGGETVELGQTAAGAVLELEGTTTSLGPLWIVVRAAVAEEEGVTWTFAVDPQLLPTRQPALEARLPPRARGRDGRWKE